MTAYVANIGGLPGHMFDRGMYVLRDRLLLIPNVEAEAMPWFSWKDARNKAVAMWAAGTLDFLMVNGHSWGCLKAVQLAEDVAKHGILVRFIGAIDPTAGPRMKVPWNVNQVSEFWATFGWPALARLRSPSGARGGRYIYPHPTPHIIQTYVTGHIALGSNSKVHEQIVTTIRGILP